MAQPLFMRLHERIPGLQLDALAPRWVAPVLERMPEIAEVIDSPFAMANCRSGTSPLARQLAQSGLPARLRPAQLAQVGADPVPAGIPERIGFTAKARYGLINRRHTLDKPRCRRWPSASPSSPKRPARRLPRPLPHPRLTSSREQQRHDARRAGHRLPEKIAVFCPGAEYGPAKRWPARHFRRAGRCLARARLRRLAARLAEGQGRSATRSSTWRSRPAPRTSAAATSLTQAIDLHRRRRFRRLQRLRPDARRRRARPAADRGLWLVVARLHAAAVERAQIISLNLECSPCFKRECPLGHLDCLNKLEPQRVLDACLTRSAA
jgi:heptosyltransferase-2